ncbi:EAL domain-containing protein [Aestuariibacter sp. A3R04]|nr:EAL domain-containing protein [Aestuariibacter sp. A3R04]
MQLFFLVLIISVVALTLLLVRSATYSHSTSQLLAQIITSERVIEDKLNNHAELLLRATDNLSGNFTIKQYIAAANDDRASLDVAMQNQQARISADIYFVLDKEKNVVAASSATLDPPANITPFITPGISWLSLPEGVFLVKGVPVKFVERSRNTDAWVFLGYRADSLINSDIGRLTDLDVNLILPSENRMLGSTLPPRLAAAFLHSTPAEKMSANELHRTTLEGVDYLYTLKPIGRLASDDVELVMLTPQDKAYLSYNSMLGQLIGLLLVAGTISLAGGVFLSKGVTGPLNKLAKAANKIRQGSHVAKFPASSTLEVDALSLALSDMQDGIESREKQIQHLAYFDDLTGLPNRNQFVTYLNKAIANQENNTVMVLMMDIDRFKEINDTVGHETGDVLLKHIAKRIQQQDSLPGLLARLGGDEYGMVITVNNDNDVEPLIGQVVAAFDQPFNIDGLVLDIDCSIGAACFPADATTPQGLMQCADIALYSCKDGHHNFARYSASLNKYSVQRLNLMSELKSALQEGQLQYYYQPKLQIDTLSITSVECLMRWIHPVHGFIPPDEFIPLAEQTGAIRHVTNWGLRTALSRQQQWREQGHNISVAVNISAVDLIDMTLPTLVSDLLSEFNAEPEYLTLEVTESAIMSDPQNALRALNALKRMGIKLSIDDFGTGYSSMAQLKDMPVHELKIDKAFVLALATNNDDKTIVNTMVSLAKNLGLEVVAEGVEDGASLQYLRSVGCTKAQGYFIAKPLPEQAFSDWLRAFTPDCLDEGKCINP